MPELAAGTICLWSGSIASIPGGWALCNGSNGTPDLRDRFVVGAGSTYNPDDTGGASNHNHTFTSDGHFHTFGGGIAMASGPNFKSETTSETDTGATQNKNHLPPYHALAYIMKV